MLARREDYKPDIVDGGLASMIGDGACTRFVTDKGIGVEDGSGKACLPSFAIEHCLLDEGGVRLGGEITLKKLVKELHRSEGGRPIIVAEPWIVLHVGFGVGDIKIADTRFGFQHRIDLQWGVNGIEKDIGGDIVTLLQGVLQEFADGFHDIALGIAIAQRAIGVG